MKGLPLTGHEKGIEQAQKALFFPTLKEKKKMGIEIEGRVEKVNGKELSYEEFVQRYMEKNQPVVLIGLMEDWRACRDWITQNGKPNLQFFSTHFGKSKVQVS